MRDRLGDFAVRYYGGDGPDTSSEYGGLGVELSQPLTGDGRGGTGNPTGVTLSGDGYNSGHRASHGGDGGEDY